MLLKQGNMPAGPDRPLCWGPITCPSSLFRHSGLLSNRPEGYRGIRTFCTGGDLSASGHVTLLLLALKTKCKLIPCSSWAMEVPWGCSPLQLNPLPTAEAVGSRGGAGAALGSCACTESVCSFFPLCLSAPGCLAQRLLPTTAQGLESGTLSDRYTAVKTLGTWVSRNL